MINKYQLSQRLTKKQKIFITISFIIGIVLFFVVLSISTLGNKKSRDKLEEKKTSVSNPADASHEANEYSSRFKKVSVTSNLQQLKKIVDTSTKTANQIYLQQTVGRKSKLERDQFLENLIRIKQQSYIEALKSDTSVRDVVLHSERTDSHPSYTSDLSLISDRLSESSDSGELRANMQKTKEKFVNTQRKFGYATQGREAPINKSEIKAGTILPAVLITEINSDLPGLITAQITENIRDSLTGKTILVPKGSRIIGSYDSKVAMGQERVLIAWNRIQFPDTSTLEIGNMGGVDGLGQAGFYDKVNNHYRRIFGNATLLALIGVGFQLSQPDHGKNHTNRGMKARDQMIAELGKQWSHVGSEMIRRNLNIQPTLHIRAGYKFNVLVNKDLILPQYQ